MDDVKRAIVKIQLFQLLAAEGHPVSKAGLEMLVKIYAGEIAKTRARANLIDPGIVRTRLRARAYPGEDPGRVPPPESITDAFYALIDAFRYRIMLRRFVRRPPGLAQPSAALLVVLPPERLAPHARQRQTIGASAAPTGRIHLMRCPPTGRYGS